MRDKRFLLVLPYTAVAKGVKPVRHHAMRRKHNMKIPKMKLMMIKLHPVDYLFGENAVLLERIVPNPYQPSDVRSTPERTKGLKASIFGSQFIAAIEVVKIPYTTKARKAWGMTLEEYPIQNSAGNTITYYGHLNGERRMQTAGRLGLEAVDVAVVDLPNADNPAVLIKSFMERQTSMSVDAAQQFTIFGKAKTEEERNALLGALTPKVARSIVEYVKLMWLDAAIKESKKGTTNPAIAQLATAFEKMCKKYRHETAIAKRRLNTITPKDMVVWMLEHGTKRLVDDVKRYHRSNENIVIGILKAVERNAECFLATANDGMKFIMEIPSKTASSKTNTPVNTTNMQTVLNLYS